jgi:hypothetical protein
LRPLIIFAFLATAFTASAQNYRLIDNRSASIEASMPDELAHKLTAPYKTDLEKFRAIFSWVTANIEYNVWRPAFAISRNRTNKQKPDTTWESRSLDERVAYNVLKNRFAVCDGYARLLKTLCDYAGISCNVIYGYAKSGDKNDRVFSTNHTWNAVFIDSAWRLADVTWASGYVSSYTNEYVKKYDNYYFLTRPKDFILSHYPEDPRWTLLDKTPFLKEYDNAPFRLKAFHKTQIVSFTPSGGHLKGRVGDTVRIRLMVEEITKPENNPASISLPHTPLQGEAILFPSVSKSKKEILYSYIVQPGIEWLNILYKDDVIMRYRMEVVNGL